MIVGVNGSRGRGDVDAKQHDLMMLKSKVEVVEALSLGGTLLGCQMDPLQHCGSTPRLSHFTHIKSTNCSPTQSRFGIFD